MKKKIVAALMAFAAVFAVSAAPAQAATDYRSAQCSVQGTYTNRLATFKVTSWKNTDGTRTWHWSGNSPYFTSTAPYDRFTFRDAKNGRSGVTYSGSEGYYTGYNGYITWTGRWWWERAGLRTEKACSATA